jgi:tRNA-specific 2-thiouridylase
MNGKRVVVGLSGGVDSSVTAYLLQQQGYEVIGMFMKNWHDDTVILDDECPWIDDSNDALLIANKLGIPFQVIDLSAEYKDRIVDYMFKEYKDGRTPNPDILCNREIKFDVFLKAATDLGADYIATGHYVRKGIHNDGTMHLLKGLDNNKDQSYFLCQLKQEQLLKALFPIGELQKHEVRAIAEEAGLHTADKKDSQGLCFVGKISLPTFLQQQLKPKEGDVIEIPDDLQMYTKYNSISVDLDHVKELAQPFTYSKADGITVAKHQGAHYYTIGQRRGLNIGGRPNPSFVIGTDTINNIVYSGQLDEHSGLNRWALFVENEALHYVNPSFVLLEDRPEEFDVRIRYRQPVQAATVVKKADGLYILFKEKQRGITPGQFAALYNKDQLVASGVIKH